MADLRQEEPLSPALETREESALDARASLAAAPPEHPAIERLLAHEEGSGSLEEGSGSLPVGLHVGAVVSIAGRVAVVSVDGTSETAALGDHIDAAFLDHAAKDGQPVLLQNRSHGGLIVLGVVQGKYPSKVVGDRVEITGHGEVVVRSGKSALRLREDGVVDLIGARISASSRGLLRLVGRALRLN